jgi:hypothetical protein
MSHLRLPALSARPFSLERSGLRWLRRSGERIGPREPVAVCYLRLGGGRSSNARLPLAEEQNDLQVVLAPRTGCTLGYKDDLSKGGYQDMVAGSAWNEGEIIGSIEGESDELLALVLAGRRGFENGEGRGALLAGWHERVRGSWEGESQAQFGTVLALGTCEQTGLFRGEDMAFLSWFGRAPGSAQLVAVSDERCVHSSAVLLQHLRRSPAEASAITEVVHSWIAERLTRKDSESFPAFQPDAARGTLQGRWPESQCLLYAMHLLAEAVGTSPMLQRSELLSRRGVIEQAPPDAVVLTLGSEFAPHFRHRRTGWTIAIHGFRFGPFIGPAVVDWLQRDFEPLPRTVQDSERDLAALSDELAGRTGATLVVQNLVASSAADRISNYSWLGDAFSQSVPVINTEANLVLSELTRHHRIAVIDSDALAAELGVRHCPDRFHASGELLSAQRAEVHRVLRELRVPGF